MRRLLSLTALSIAALLAVALAPAAAEGPGTYPGYERSITYSTSSKTTRVSQYVTVRIDRRYYHASAIASRTDHSSIPQPGGSDKGRFHRLFVGMQVIDRRTGEFVTTARCDGRWTCSLADLPTNGRTSHYTFRSRFCGDYADDGKGLRCTAWSTDSFNN